MTARRRLFSLLASVLLIVPVLVAIPAAALAQTSYQLNLSLNPDRSAATALEGATVSGDMFVFTGPDDDIDVVRFWIDDPTGTPFRTESIAPFDLAGTNDLFGGTDAAPFDSTILTDGPHTVYAEIQFFGGATTDVSSTFNVANSTPALEFSDDSLTFDLDLGDPAASDSVDLSATSGTANYTLTVVQNPEGLSWLTVDPLSGSTSDTVDLEVDPSGLTAGLYTATVIASAPGYLGDSFDISLNLNDPSAGPGLRIAYSTSSNRSAPSDLDGAVVDDSIYVFVTDASGAPVPGVSISQVRYYTNGSSSPTQTENYAPYDYEAGSTSNANPFDTTDESDGPFQISAEVDVVGEGTTNLVADFTIQNFGPPVPLVSLSPGSINFGEIVDGNIVVETVSLSNVGSAPLSVTAIDVTGAGFDLDGENCPGSLAPGESCEIDVEFDPAGTGGFNGSLSVTSNATSSPDVVPLSGSSVDAEPAIQLSPISISFGDVVVGSTEQASITVASIGNVPLSIDNIEVSGAGFSLLGDDCPGSLNPGSDCSIDVEFAPTEDDDYAGSVVVSSSSDASPDFAPLSGTGVLPPEEGLRIAYSVTSNRAAPSDLDGAAVMDTIYVFVTDETGAPAPGVSISQVRFSTNGTQTQTENIAPYDYEGGSTANANPFDTTGEADGPFQISAEVDVVGEGTTNLVADFLIQNSGPPVPLASLSPGSVDFGELIGSETAVETVTLSSSGSAPLSVGAINVTGAGFSLDGQNCPSSLAPGASCSIDIEFDPSGVGPYTGSLSVESNDASSPDVVPLSGSAADPTPDAALSPSLVDFGDVVVGESAVAQVTLSSVGNVALDITDIDTDTPEFVVTGDSCPTSLVPGASCSINVEFTPTDLDSYGGLLQLYSNSFAGIESASLAGNGVEAPEEGLRIAYSVTSNRAAPSDLDGAAVMDTIYVFVTDETGAPAPGVSISQVRFSTNGTQTQTENIAPYDYEGGSTANANPFDTTGEADGPFQISAEVDVVGEGTTNLVADFVIQNTVPQPIISVDPSSIDFGQVDVGDTGGPVTVTVSNIGTADLQITDLGALAPFDTPTTDCATAVTPGGSCTIDVTFAPAAFGPAAENLQINSNSVTGTVTLIPLSGFGYVPAPGVDLNPTSLTFAETNVGDTAVAQQVTLTNSGDADLDISSITTTNGDFGLSDDCPTTLGAGTSCTIDVDFTPTADGPVAGDLEVASNATSSPDAVALSGEGNVPAPAVALDPASLVFPLTNVGDTAAAQQVTLTNNGDGDLDLLDFGATNIDFGVYSAACPGTLTPGASCVIDVDFTATTAGPASGDVYVETNASSSPDTVAVSGEGFEAEELTLVYSLSSDRSSPMPLDGAVVSGDIWVFVDPVFPTTPINSVEFSFDGPVTQVESLVPYDFAGTGFGTPYPFETTGETDGLHNIGADVNLSAGGTLVLSADFEIDNSFGLATVGITPGAALGASTYDGDAFQITNTGTVNIEQVVIDLSNSFLPDMVFDPVGTAGDNTAKCVEPNNGLSDNVGYVTPANPCVSPFSGGSGVDGYSTVTLDFNGFGPGETFVFSTDVDPTTIKGFSAAGNAGAISGLELAGATATVTFADGVEASQTFGDGSDGGGVATVPSGAAGTPTLSVSGATLSPTTLSNGATAATVPVDAQTILISGPANSTVTLIHVSGDLEDEPSGGYNDLEDYEINEADTVEYINVVLDGSGNGSAPVTLYDGMNYFRAAVAAAGETGENSNVVILELGIVPGDDPAVLVEITPGGDLSGGTSTFLPGSFSIANVGDEPINSVEIDISGSLFPNLVFDPVGLAGDTDASCLELDSGAVATGYQAPFNPCADPYSDGNDTDGYKVITLGFDDFDPGETITFHADVDPHSIQGASGAASSGKINGTELSGSMVTVDFAGTGTIVGRVFKEDDSVGGSEATVTTVATPTPLITPSGVAVAPTGFSNGAWAGQVTAAAQTIDLLGLSGQTVRLIQVDTDVNGIVSGSPAPYEANEATAVVEHTVTLDGTGSGSIPVTLTDELTYFMATSPSAGTTSVASSSLYLQLLSQPNPPDAALTITPGAGIDASTYAADSFTVTNTGSTTITTVHVDLSTALFPDVVFDPAGTAGDITASCLLPHGSSDDVGYTDPGDECVDPFSDGDALDGYKLATLSFTDFDPGESFVFTVDVDPSSIKGYAAAGNAGAISGLELAGTTFTAVGPNGTASARTFGDGSAGGGIGATTNENPPGVTLEVVDVALGATGFSNGALGAFVTETAQTALVTGPDGAAVTLIVVNANLEDEPDGGFNALDPFERNKAQSVTYIDSSFGGDGTVEIPFTVSDVDGETTYLLAAVDDTAGPTVGAHNQVSVPAYLELTDAPPPAGEVLYRVNNGGPALAATDGGPDWEADQSAANAGGAAATGIPSPYLSAAYTDDNTFGDTDEVISLDSSVPGYVPIELFTMERWDPGTAVDNNEMTFEFDVASGVEYEVRLYLAEIWDNIVTDGPRIFSVDVEGTTYGPIDVHATYGADVGVMLAYPAQVADDSLTVTFLHDAENPSVKGIEILAAGEIVTGNLPLTTDTEADGATAGDPVETTVDPPSSGGVYDGSLSEGPITASTPIGFELFGQQVSISVTPDSPGSADPFGVVFELDASILPVDWADVEVFKDGVLVEECPSDPCETSRVELGSGNLQIAIESSTFSEWTFGFVPPVDLEADQSFVDFADVPVGTTPTVDVTFTHTGTAGSAQITVDPADITIAGAAELTIGSAPTTTQVLDAGQSFVVTVAYAPTSAPALHNATLSVAHDGADSPTEVVIAANTIAGPMSGDVLFRVNGGGDTVTDTPDWTADTSGAQSVYLTSTGHSTYGGVAVNTVDGTVPAGTPLAVFAQERWDDVGGDELLWQFPVPTGTLVEVRLYLAEAYDQITAPGGRVFDVTVDGALPAEFDDLDPFALAGGLGIGTMVSAEIVSDGSVDLEFIHGTQNPAVRGLEILVAGAQPNVLGVSPGALNFGSVLVGSSTTQSVTLTNLGDPAVPDATIAVNSVALASDTVFSITGQPGLPFDLLPGASTTVEVTYNPPSVDSNLDTLTIGSTADNSSVDIAVQGTALSDIPISFGSAGLTGESLSNPTSLDFGPDGRLYVTQQNGMIYAYTIARDGAPAGSGAYSVTNTEPIDLVKNIPNHNDDGTLNTGETNRQVTGILASGTAANPVLYVTSSDPRIGAGGSGTDENLDTNSGVISKLTWNGASWDKVDVVRGLPRSEENHATNGMALTPDGNTLYVAQGGHTNQGAPSNNFAQTPEYALSAAILEVNLALIDSAHGGAYDLPTVGRAAGAVPFGGNDGATQAVWDVDGPVQVYSPGYRNPYDVVLTEDGNLYTFDNGPNGGWGDVPVTSGGLCTNTSNEPGQTAPDNLHYISGEGYYGGHPNPTRANTGLVAGAVDGTPPYDTSVECTYLTSNGNPPRPDGSLATVGSSTNGLAEYTASNFGGAMQGDLLAAAFNGNIYRMKLTAAGDDLVGLTTDPNNPEQALFNGFGATPLDVTTQGDGDVFPGTVWAATYGANNITVFEPADFGTSCTGAYNPALDEDSDNYDNADEIDNGTDPCNGGSQPTDWDGDFTSDLNDPDDDDDTILDVNDAFALDPNNGLVTTAPLLYPLDLNSVGVSELPPFGTFKNVGFTGLMLDPSGTTDYLTQFDEGNLNVGGATGVFSADFSSDGDATNNDQDNAFQFGVDPTSLAGEFTVHVQTVQPFPSVAIPTNYQSVGFYIGNGDQDNYLKLVANANGAGGAGTVGTGGFQLGGEVAGSFSSAASVADSGVVGDAVDIDLYLAVDPTVVGDPTVDGYYRINGGPLNAVGSTTIPAGWLAGPDAFAVGLISTSLGAGPITPAWELVEISLGAPDTTAPAAPTNLVATGSDGQVSLDWDDNAEGDLDVYSVYRSETTPVDTSGLPIAQPTDSEYLDTLVTNGTTYHYAVTARDTSLNESAASNEDDATPMAPSGSALFRINVGGDEVAAADASLPMWAEDTDANPSSYRTNGQNVYSASAGNAHPGPVDMTDPSIPASAPIDVFEIERWDPGASGDLLTDEMQWDFPVAAGTEVEVTLLFAELFSGNDAVGDRVFDVQIEGGTPAALDDLDPFAVAGAKGAFAVSHVVAVGVDGNLDIDFIHSANDHPALKGIEVKIPEPRAIQVISPTAGEVIVGDEVTVEWTTSGGLLGDDHVHLDLNGVYQGSLPQNDTFTFTAVAPGPQTLVATVANSTHTEYTNLEASVTVNFTVEAPPSPVLYRVNAGGGELPALDGGPVWAADDGSLVGGSSTTGGYANTNGSDASVPATTPNADPDNVFLSERYGTDAGDPMQWDFPVTSGELVEVRLFMHSGWNGADQIGEREFDVTAEGIQILDDYDLVDDVGHRVGVMKSIVVTSDGNIDIDFGHVTENPVVNAVEIVTVDSNPSGLTANPNPIDFGTVDVGVGGDAVVTLQNAGLAAGPSVVIDSTGFGVLTNIVDDAVFPIVLFPGDTQDVTLTWSPPATELLGGTYFINSNGSNDPLAVSVVGEAVVPTNTDPTVDPIADEFIAEMDTLSVTFGADDFDGDTLTVTQTGLPPSATITDNLNDTYTLEWATNLADSGEYDVVVEVDDGNGGVVTEDFFLSVSQTLSGDVAYRVNAGGGTVSDTPDWTADTTGSNSLYLVAAGNNQSATTGDTISVAHATVPAGTPQGVLNVERWSDGGLQWEFPLAEGAEAEVRLYFVETYVNGDGLREFDVEIEGVQVLDDYDIHALVGHDAAIVEDFLVTMGAGDNTLDIDFTNVTDNTAIKGIEIIVVNPAPAADLLVNVGGLNFGDVAVGAASAPQTVTYTHPGLVGTAGIEITNVVIGGANTADFAPSPTSSVVLAPGDSHDIDVTFTPGAPGARSASLDTTETGSVSGGNSVPLAGNGVSNNAPTIDAIDDIQVSAGEPVGFAVNATDLDVADTIVLGISSTPALPAGAVFTDVGDGTGSLNWPTTAGDVGIYDVDVTADDGTTLTTESLMIVVGEQLPLNVNAGGAATQPAGWVDEGPFRGGSSSNQPGASGAIDMTHSSVTSQADVPPMAVFQTEVYGPQTFDFVVPDGSYEVRLLFAETFVTAAGARLFGVDIEGVNVLNEYDVYATAGTGLKGVVETFLVEVNDGNGLTVEMVVGSVQSPSVRGIMIRKVVHAANAGAGAVEIWDAGSAFVSGGSSFGTGDTITLDPSAPGNTPQSVFQNEVYGNSTWTFGVADGDYEVQLFLAETFQTTAAARFFDVNIESVLVLDDYDIIAEGFGHDVGFVHRFPAAVADGDIVVELVNVAGGDNASIKGIVIIEKSLATP